MCLCTAIRENSTGHSTRACSRAPRVTGVTSALASPSESSSSHPDTVIGEFDGQDFDAPRIEIDLGTPALFRRDRPHRAPFDDLGRNRARSDAVRDYCPRVLKIHPKPRDGQLGSPGRRGDSATIAGMAAARLAQREPPGLAALSQPARRCRRTRFGKSAVVLGRRAPGRH